MIVADYSFARPDPAVLAAAGFSGVVRYLSRDTRKNLSIPERDALHAHGLPISLVWETTANMMDSGPLGGARDAQEANAQADGLGYPLDRPIYFANDRNEISEESLGYMRGAAAASRRPVGAYGSSDFCTISGASYRWKVSTWGPPISAQLIQEANSTSPVAGTDLNTATGDWGGWLDMGAPPPPRPRRHTGRNLLAALATFIGEPYSTAAGRTDPMSGYGDCSGEIVKAFTVLQIPTGGTVSTSLERWAISTGGHYISREEALVTPGAGLTIGGRADGWTGAGPKGHIELSVGDGATSLGTPSQYFHGCGYSDFGYQRWTGYFTWGVLDHSDQQQGDDDDMGFLAKVHFDDRVWYCRAGVRSVIPNGSLEVMAQLAQAGAVRDPVDVRLVGPATLSLYKPLRLYPDYAQG